LELIAFFTSFVLISLAAYLVGKAFTRINLSYITNWAISQKEWSKQKKTAQLV